MAGRGLGLLFIFAVMGVSVLHLRSETLRASAQIQSLRMEQVRLRRETWTLEMSIARINTPMQLRERMALWELNLTAPKTEPLHPRRQLLATAQ